MYGYLAGERVDGRSSGQVGTCVCASRVRSGSTDTVVRVRWDGDGGATRWVPVLSIRTHRRIG